ncbi:hypothetical protein TRIUR3_20957 [Triticum urartu]|uniref:Uncharacterized protein n=1 Tax=Triticum urartu TaxID=4572 RepID=M7ZS39_TRIUA|nr:hypothetical protein TRIUR3_20957 [Triticum urartu]
MALGDGSPTRFVEVPDVHEVDGRRSRHRASRYLPGLKNRRGTRFVEVLDVHEVDGRRSRHRASRKGSGAWSLGLSLQGGGPATRGPTTGVVQQGDDDGARLVADLVGRQRRGAVEWRPWQMGAARSSNLLLVTGADKARGGEASRLREQRGRPSRACWWPCGRDGGEEADGLRPGS